MGRRGHLLDRRVHCSPAISSLFQLCVSHVLSEEGFSAMISKGAPRSSSATLQTLHDAHLQIVLLRIQEISHALTVDFHDRQGHLCRESMRLGM